MSNGNDCCALCGTRSGRLHVHHVEGYQNVHYDDLSTLITLCPTHHVRLERWTEVISKFDPVRRRHAALVILGLLGDTIAFNRGRSLVGGSSA